MAKIRRDEVIAAALALLDDVGLDDFTTRRLAQRLGVESATLYWHFEDKAALLAEMANAALVSHHASSQPEDAARWAEWFADNARSFRRALLSYRDGARLHAGSVPSREDFARIAPKIAYLVRAGFAQHEASMALYTASQLTIGSVLEEQARSSRKATRSDEMMADVEAVIAEGSDLAFEFGLGLLTDGLRFTLARTNVRR